jgi:hypothetical protein
MPRLRNELHEPLVEDHHYFSVDADMERDDPALVAGRLARRFAEIRDRPDRLRAVAANARAWYERNARIPDAFDLTVRLAGLTRPPAPLRSAVRRLLPAPPPRRRPPPTG